MMKDGKKYIKGTLSGMRQSLVTEIPLQVIKNTFIPPKKLFLFSKYFSFCFDFLVMYRNGLIKKITLISNFMTPQPG